MERTPKVAMPPLVFCGDDVVSAVEAPLTLVKLTAYVPLLVGLPFASVTTTRPDDVEAPSAAMGVGEKLQARPAAGPGLNTIVALAGLTDEAVLSVKVSVQPDVAAVLEKVNEARPAVVVPVPVVAVDPDAGVRADGQPLPAVPLVG
jgi:hypothetical protein